MSYYLYHSVNSRSQRIIWLMEELELDYELEICDAVTHNASFLKLKALDPNPKFPMLHIQTEQNHHAILLSETTAICDYLSHKYQKLGINELQETEQIAFHYWKNFAEASFMPNMALKQVFSQIVIRTPFFARPISRIIKSAFDQGFLNGDLNLQIQKIDSHLAQQQWVVESTFSIADIILWFPLRACFYSDPQFKRYIHVKRYLNDLENRPCFQRALKKGQWSESLFIQYWAKAW